MLQCLRYWLLFTLLFTLFDWSQFRVQDEDSVNNKTKNCVTFCSLNRTVIEIWTKEWDGLVDTDIDWEDIDIESDIDIYAWNYLRAR